MSADPTSLEVIHNPQENRFEVTVDGHTAVLTYRLSDNIISFNHTGVPSAIERRGIGGQLAKAGLEYAKLQGYRVRPICPFIADYIKKHPEYKTLL